MSALTSNQLHTATQNYTSIRYLIPNLFNLEYYVDFNDGHDQNKGYLAIFMMFREVWSRDL